MSVRSPWIASTISVLSSTNITTATWELFQKSSPEPGLSQPNHATRAAQTAAVKPAETPPTTAATATAGKKVMKGMPTTTGSTTKRRAVATPRQATATACPFQNDMGPPGKAFSNRRAMR